MLSVASLLNPVKPESRGTRPPSSPSSSLYTSSSTYGSPHLSFTSLPTSKKAKMTKDGAIFTKGKIKGEVNFPPFESFDGDVLREIQKFQIYPPGNIQEYAQHIPYNSEKKSFLEKTGRESFEVFKYVFKVPGDDKEYVVMWDYNIGLVRITPFFKCCKYSKTTPAKMLNMNPGLKEITHSITGGALVAQGYWMPYSCALAVCTTFCSHIAGALIPIFGPTFPSLCVPPEAPEHGRMIIDSQTVREATAEAEAFRIQYSNFPAPRSSTSTRDSYSPIHSSSDREREYKSIDPHMRRTPPNLGRRLRVRRAFGGESPYGLVTDSELDTNASESSGDGYFLSPVTPVSGSSMMSASHLQGHSMSQSHLHSRSQVQGPGQGQVQGQVQVPISQPTMNTWHAHNLASHHSNASINISPHHNYTHHPHTYKSAHPLLSAIPRSIGLDIAMTGTWRSGASKRRVEEVDADDEYDGETASVVTDDKGSADGKLGSASGSGSGSARGSDRSMDDGSASGGAEKKAAWLLMKLSVRDGEVGGEAYSGGNGNGNGDSGDLSSGFGTSAAVGVGGGLGFGMGGGYGSEGPRVKRRRAASM